MPDESYDERFKDVHLTNSTAAMKEKFPDLYTRENANQFERKFKEKVREGFSYPARRTERNMEKREAVTQDNKNAAKDRGENKVQGRDFAYAKDDPKHWTSRSRWGSNLDPRTESFSWNQLRLTPQDLVMAWCFERTFRSRLDNLLSVVTSYRPAWNLMYIMYL